MQERDNNGKVLELKVVLLGLIKSCSKLSESQQQCYDGVKLKCFSRNFLIFFSSVNQSPVLDSEEAATSAHV